jgi:hypothetical protein
MKKPSPPEFDDEDFNDKEFGYNLDRDCLATFGLTIAELQWIDALWATDKWNDPRDLIFLLEEEKVPDRVMPYLADFLAIKFKRKTPGRPAPLYVKSLKQRAFKFALAKVKELTATGMKAPDAIAHVNARLGIAMPADIYTGRSGYSRRLRK